MNKKLLFSTVLVLIFLSGCLAEKPWKTHPDESFMENIISQGTREGLILDKNRTLIGLRGSHNYTTNKADWWYVYATNRTGRYGNCKVVEFNTFSIPSINGSIEGVIRNRGMYIVSSGNLISIANKTGKPIISEWMKPTTTDFDPGITPDYFENKSCDGTSPGAPQATVSITARISCVDEYCTYSGYRTSYIECDCVEEVLE